MRKILSLCLVLMFLLVGCASSPIDTPKGEESSITNEERDTLEDTVEGETIDEDETLEEKADELIETPKEGEDGIIDSKEEPSKSEEELNSPSTVDQNKSTVDEPSKTIQKPTDVKNTVTKTESKDVNVAYKTVKENDSSLEKGKTLVSQKGVNGKERISYQVTYTNGKETGRVETGRKTITSVVNEVIQVGTKVASAPEPTEKKWTVPNMVGLSKDDALNALNNMLSSMAGASDGFKTELKYVETTGGNVGKVMKQSVAPGQHASYSGITLTIGKETPKEDPSGTGSYSISYNSSVEQEIFRLVNQYRKENGLHEYKWSNSLHKSARDKSHSMINYNYFGHHNPQLGGGGISSLMWDKHKVGFNSIGENIAAVYGKKGTANELFTQWKNSPPHNAAMLDSGTTHMSVGVADTPKAGSQFGNTVTTIGTQHFGQ